MTAPTDRTMMLVLAYLWPLALVPLLLAKHDAELRWHAKHGLMLTVAEFLILVLLALVVLTGISSIAFFVIGGATIVALAIAILAVHAVAILRALTGGRLNVPVVTDLANRF